MNLSGRSAAAAVAQLKLDLGRVLVIADDIALPPGKVRLRAQGSAGGHKGLASVIEELETERFARLRVGVGAPQGEDAADYVLARIPTEEQKVIAPALKRAADAAEAWLADGAAKAMTAFND